METDRSRHFGLQGDGDVHHASKRRVLSAIGRPHRHDAEHGVLAVQGAVRATYHELGEQASNDTGEQDTCLKR